MITESILNHQFALRSRAFADIDTSNGVIRGVSVITVGPALGHGIDIDAHTLSQVKSCAETYQGGLKVKMEHGGGAGDIVGRLNNFRIEANQLLADLTLLKTSPHREYIMELAQTIPDTFGLSIAFTGPVESVGTMNMARCTEIYSADLVSEPAANPTGLFDASPLVKAGTQPALQPKPTIDMDETQIKTIVDSAIAAAIEPFSARLAKLETPVAPELTPEENDKAKLEALTPEEIDKAKQEELSKVAELSAVAALKLFAAQFGSPPAPVSAEPVAPVDAPKKFEDLVAAKAKECGSKIEAIRFCAKNNLSEHASYLDRVNAGEVITL